MSLKRSTHTRAPISTRIHTTEMSEYKLQSAPEGNHFLRVINSLLTLLTFQAECNAMRPTKADYIQYA